MKKESGITLISLIIYVVGITIITGVITVITNFFFSNIVFMDEAADSAAEYSKFNIAFIDEVKTPGITIQDIGSDYVIFSSGNKYSFKNNIIYKNSIELANDITECEFSSYEYEKKTIVSVDITVGQNGNGFSQKIDYVLSYSNEG